MDRGTVRHTPLIRIHFTKKEVYNVSLEDVIYHRKSHVHIHICIFIGMFVFIDV